MRKRPNVNQEGSWPGTYHRVTRTVWLTRTATATWSCCHTVNQTGAYVVLPPVLDRFEDGA